MKRDEYFLVKGAFATGRYAFTGVRVFFEAFLAFILVYWLFTVILSRISVEAERISSHDLHVQIWITSNGVHSDVVVPVINEQMDWGKELGLTEELKQDTARKYLAFGWGNEKFFMNTKNWSDLTFGTAFGAAFHLGTSAMHIVQRGEPTGKNEEIISLTIDRQQYEKLVGFLRASFGKKDGKYVPIPNHPYGKYDFFFEAVRSYGLSYTCNSWTNDALKSAGQKACVWTAFKDGIFVQYEK